MGFGWSKVCPRSEKIHPYCTIRRILGMILKETSRMALVGIVTGLGTALLFSRLLRAMLSGLKPNDPVTLGSSALLLLGVALIAGFIPALRASRVDPMQVLRHE
jgi:ABC-type antimicrobial peptide transport system permease subunit